MKCSIVLISFSTATGSIADNNASTLAGIFNLAKNATNGSYIFDQLQSISTVNFCDTLKIFVNKIKYKFLPNSVSSLWINVI